MDHIPGFTFLPARQGAIPQALDTSSMSERIVITQPEPARKKHRLVRKHQVAQQVGDCLKSAGQYTGAFAEHNSAQLKAGLLSGGLALALYLLSKRRSAGAKDISPAVARCQVRTYNVRQRLTHCIAACMSTTNVSCKPLGCQSVCAMTCRQQKHCQLPAHVRLLKLHQLHPQH